MLKHHGGNVKNHIDMLTFHATICAEDVTNRRDATTEIAVASSVTRFLQNK